MIRWSLRLVAWACLIFCLGARAAPSDVGIVLMHGKWDGPPTRVTVLSRVLQSKGFRVVTPIMAWSGPRSYDVDYPATLAEIDAAVQALRSEGAKRIVVGGHSFGANAAIAYAGSGREVDAILAVAPGHVPDSGRLRRKYADGVEKARRMIAEGNGDRKSDFEDSNQGREKTIRTTAKIYFSYFDPEGIAAMSRSAAAIRRPTPFLWIVERTNPLERAGPDYAFNKAPPHPSSKYVVVQSSHLDTPADAADQIADWLLSLGY